MEVLDIAGMASHVAAEKSWCTETRSSLKANADSEQYLKKIASSFSDVNVRCTVERGRPEDVIIEKAAADKTTLIAMATHGRSGDEPLAIGEHCGESPACYN